VLGFRGRREASLSEVRRGRGVAVNRAGPTVIPEIAFQAGVRRGAGAVRGRGESSAVEAAHRALQVAFHAPWEERQWAA